MPTMQASRAELRQQIHDQVQSAVQQAQAARDAANQTAGQIAGQNPAGGKGQGTPVLAPSAPLPPIPVGGGRLIIDKRGDQTVITSAALPPELLPVMRIAQETALGLMGLLAAIFILGPFARMFARRADRTTEIKAAGQNSQVLGQQLLQLQQSVDAMAIEVERISESQRFQSKLLSDRKSS